MFDHMDEMILDRFIEYLKHNDIVFYKLNEGTREYKTVVNEYIKEDSLRV